MRPLLLPLLLHLAALSAAEPPTDWLDPDTGHRIVRLSTEPGTASLYFNQNAYTPDGKKLLVTSPRGLSTIDLATRQIDLIVAGEVRVIVAGRKTGDLYYTKREGADTFVYATHVATKATRHIARLPRGGVSSINADETLLLGVYTEGASAPPSGMSNTSASQPNNGGANPTFQANYAAQWPDGTPMTYAEAKDLSLHRRLLAIRQGPPQVIFTVNLATGEIREVLKEREWIGHLQFSPTDPQQILFCHEGTWHEVDRVWLIRTDGTGLTKVHPRTMNMEIAGQKSSPRGVWRSYQTVRPSALKNSWPAISMFMVRVWTLVRPVPSVRMSQTRSTSCHVPSWQNRI